MIRENLTMVKEGSSSIEVKNITNPSIESRLATKNNSPGMKQPGLLELLTFKSFLVETVKLMKLPLKLSY